MFAIYGISGPIFQGTLEKLGPLAPVPRADAVIAARRVGDQSESPRVPDVLPFTSTPSGAREPAVDAYQSMLPANLERGPIYAAMQLMQRAILTVNADDEVARAWRIFADQHVDQAPVLDAERNLVGILGERNLLTALDVGASQMAGALTRRVGEVMTTPVVCARPATDIRRIARVMLERDVDGVPIVSEDGRLVGFISRGDILRAVVADPPLSIWS